MTLKTKHPFQFTTAYQIKQEIQKKPQLAARAKILSPEIPGLAYAENNL